MNPTGQEIHQQLNFQASLLRLMHRLETTATTTTDEKVAVEVEKLASRL
jgi:hypothetical protein